MTRILPLLLLIALAACSSGRDRSVRLLDRRLHATLAGEVEAGRATVRRLPDGVRVTLIPPGMFDNGTEALDGRVVDIRSSVIEGLLDPKMMRVEVADTSGLPAVRRLIRVRNVEAYFTAYGLGSVLASSDTAPASSPSGLVMTIHVVCPDWHDGTGYSDGTPKPVCE